MALFNLKYNTEKSVLEVSFGEMAHGDAIVKEVSEIISDTIPTIPSGKILKISGPMSLSVSMFIAHKLSHLVPAIAVFDPKLPGDQKFIVCVSHTPDYKVGDTI